MRLHRLELTAFGPFAGTVSVDLDALGADGLFLVQGDTGAGKTTLLDGVAFALFGRVPGPRNEAKRLRCDRAPADAVTTVVLEATIGGHRLEIIRRPEYERPKSRGTGTTLQRGKVTLRWLGDAPPGRPEEGLTRADEIGDAIIEALGMSADQFFQVVLLPQGDFARFLRADTAERADLLQRLFDTGRFGRIEDWFATARRDAGIRLRDCDDRVRQMLARVAEAAGGEPPQDAGPEWLADVRDRLADAADEAANSAQLARAERDAAARSLEQATALWARLARLRELRQQARLLQARGTQIDRDRLLIQQHVRTAPVVAAASSFVAARLALSAAQRRHADAVSTLAAVNAIPAEPPVPDPGMLAGDPVAVRAAADADRDLAGALTGVIADAAEQDRDAAALAKLKRRHHLDEVAAVDVEQRLAGLPAKIAELETRVAGARLARDLLPAAGKQLESAQRILDVARSVPVLRGELAAAIAAAAAAIDRHQAAVDLRQRLVDGRLAGMAAELATALVPGESCPVCGSPEHPAIVTSATSAVTPAQIRAAEAAEQAESAARQQESERRWRVSTALDHAIEAAAGRDISVAELELQETVERHRRLAAVARNFDALVGLREAAGKAQFEHGLRREELTTAVAAGTAEIRFLSQRIDKRAAQLEQARSGHPTVRDRRAHLLRRAAALDAVASSFTAVEAQSTVFATCEQELQRAVTGAGFPGLTEALAIAELDVGALRQAVRSWEDATAAVAAQLTDPQFTGLSEDETVQVEVNREAARISAAVAERAIALAHELATRRDQVSIAARRLMAAWRDREPVAAQEAQVAALADLMHGRGQNAVAMSLRTYVLAERLKQVAAVAGQRLDRMSSGRYTFVHSTDREARGKAGGLGLDILDGWSGLIRSTKTLSGGESFLASLALALGLADVVAAEAGGRVLDTLFVDEGFGSLDPDTLDLVMGTLDDLRAGGRVVGVVSHVDELRQRIPSQVRVVRTQQGSTIQVTTG